MKTRKLGPGAAEVSAIGYGGMMISIQGRPPEEQGIRAIHAALDSGATLIDTADVYCLDDGDIGHNERLIAKALKLWSGPRDHIVIATKGGLTRPAGQWHRKADPAHLRQACDCSLEALGVERIDLYQLHAPDSNVPFTDSVGTLAELQRQGKVRWLGLSNVSVKEIEKAGKIIDVVTVQNRLNPFFREALKREMLVGPSVVEHCTGKGIGFLAYSPVGGGRLNKKLPGHPVLEPIAKRYGASAHAVAIAWVRAKGSTVIPIPAGRDPQHVRDSMSAADIDLTPDDIEAIDRAEFSRD
ncbi:MAG: aldo/keto reductase [Gemmatimonadetes bacterium]|nr:aldo/keto reductase [Gemmatimonadota bacterium]